MSHDLKAVSKLTSVLQWIDINTFFHIRITRTNQFFILSNNQHIADYFIQENNSVEIMPITLATTSVCGKISAVYWMNYEHDSFISALRRFGISNGITVALPFNDHIDIFSFASSLENTQLNNFYLNHFRLIKRFIVFFRLKARKIIEHANSHLYSLKNKMVLYSQPTTQDKNATLEALRKIPPRKASMQATYVEKIDLTEKETTYLEPV